MSELHKKDKPSLEGIFIERADAKARWEALQTEDEDDLMAAIERRKSEKLPAPPAP